MYNHVATVSGLSSFQLVGGYPPKPIDLKSTVEASDLADATLIQKWFFNKIDLTKWTNPYKYWLTIKIRG